QLQDVRLVDAVDRPAAVPAGQLEGEPEEPHAGRLGHDLEALHDAGDQLVLAGGVDVLGDLADQQEVHAGEPGGDARQVVDRADRREEAQPAAEGDVEVGRHL